MLRESWPEYVRDLHQPDSLADRTVALDAPTDFTCRSDELRVGIANLAKVQHTAAVASQHRRAGEPVIDMTFGVSGGGRRNAKHSTHDRRSQIAPRAYVTHTTLALCCETQPPSAGCFTMKTDRPKPGRQRHALLTNSHTASQREHTPSEHPCGIWLGSSKPQRTGARPSKGISSVRRGSHPRPNAPQPGPLPAHSWLLHLLSSTYLLPPIQHEGCTRSRTSAVVTIRSLSATLRHFGHLFPTTPAHELATLVGRGLASPPGQQHGLLRGWCERAASKIAVA